MTQDNTPARPAQRLQKEGFKKSKPSAKKVSGHEAFLKNLETTDSKIKIQTSAGETYEGIVKRSDAYTISLQVSGELTPKVFFKHCIEFFQPLFPLEKKSTVE